MRPKDVERLAHDIRKMAGLAEDRPVYATRIAARLLGPDHVAIDPTLPTRAMLERRDGGFFVVLRELGDDFNFAIAHEVAHFALRSLAGYRGPEDEEEQLANYLGAALLAPPTAVRAARVAFGDTYKRLARSFALSQTSIILRLSEVLDETLAVQTRNGHRLTGFQRAFPWESAEGPGIAKTALTGGIDEGRTALRIK